MMNDELEFLRSGLRYYPAAARTVKQFKDMIVAELEGCLERHWSSDEKARPYESFGRDSYLEVWQRVKIDGYEPAVSVGIGIGWDNKGTYLYAYCPDGPDWARRATGPEFEKDKAYNVFFRYADIDTFEAEQIEILVRDFKAAVRPPQQGSVSGV